MITNFRLFEDTLYQQKYTAKKFPSILELWMELHKYGATANWISKYMEAIVMNKNVLYNIWKDINLDMNAAPVSYQKTQIIKNFKCELDDERHKSILEGEYLETDILFFNDESVDYFNPMYIYNYEVPIALEEELNKMKTQSRFDL